MDLDPNEFPSPFDNVVPASQAKTYIAKYLREIEIEIYAADLDAAEKFARCAAGKAKLLSVVSKGYVEPGEAPKTADLNERRNAQLAVRVRELTDQPEPDRVA